MDSILFEEWVREVDRRFIKEVQKIVLLVDNCPAHPSIDNLVSTELIFLSPNTTSKFQSMDQGVIRSLKAHYKTMSIKKLIEAKEKKKPLPEFSILDAMQMLDVAWGKITTKTVVNCFEKAGISKEKQSEANWISLPYITKSSSQKEPPLIILSLWMILSPALSH